MNNIRTAMNRGAFDFVTKPIDFVDLEKTIGKTLQHIEVLREARRRQSAAEQAYASLCAVRGAGDGRARRFRSSRIEWQRLAPRLISNRLGHEVDVV
jgi:YesN/AraC family two-component response regulator